MRLRHLEVLITQYKANERAPDLLPADADAAERTKYCGEYARWLWNTGDWTQTRIAKVLNDQGQTTRYGKSWTQPNLRPLLMLNPVSAS